MKNMTRDGVTYLGPEFDDFLFAPIGTEKNGMLLTVLSALARQNVDPWHEARQLAGLPERTAVQRLASLIDISPEGYSLRPNIEATALRLIALLPHHAVSKIVSTDELPDTKAINEFGIILYIVFILFALTVQLTVSSHQMSSQAGNTHDTTAPEQNIHNSGHAHGIE